MILLTALFIVLVGLVIFGLIGGASIIIMLADVIVFGAIVALVVKLFTKKG